MYVLLLAAVYRVNHLPYIFVWMNAITCIDIPFPFLGHPGGCFLDSYLSDSGLIQTVLAQKTNKCAAFAESYVVGFSSANPAVKLDGSLKNSCVWRRLKLLDLLDGEAVGASSQS